MIDRAALKKWTRAHHNEKTQALVLSYIATQVAEFEAFGFDNIYMATIYCQCSTIYTYVSTSTMCRWWKIYMEWGEIPNVAKEKKRKI